MKSKHRIERLVNGGYCIGCGACSVQSNQVEVSLSEVGLYEAKVNGDVSSNVEDVCPFLSTIDENVLGSHLYAGQEAFHKTVGHYLNVYTGYVNSQEDRSKSSSGGLLTWVLESLMKQGDIDGVIHVRESVDDNSLFNYRLSTSIEEIKSGAKSKYYPISYAEVLQELKTKNLKVAFVGVPCFIKSVRLLCKSDSELAKRIPFCISLFCGHLKSTGFAEMIAWQQGVKPEKLSNIDFRVKNSTQAHQYSVQVQAKDSKSPVAPASIRHLFGMDWGLGYFKPVACDWCDDIAGETADITLGDAWLPEYQNDAGGHNIVVVRHPLVLKLLQAGMHRGEIHLNEESVDKVYQSQAANYRHRQEGLDIRQRHAQEKGIWFPKKRIQAYDFSVPEIRQSIYLLRSKIAARSHKALLQAKQNNSFHVFLIKMLPLQVKYYWLNKRLFKQTLIYVFQMGHYYWRKIKK